MGFFNNIHSSLKSMIDSKFYIPVDQERYLRDLLNNGQFYGYMFVGNPKHYKLGWHTVDDNEFSITGLSWSKTTTGRVYSITTHKFSYKELYDKALELVSPELLWENNASKLGIIPLFDQGGNIQVLIDNGEDHSSLCVILSPLDHEEDVYSNFICV